MTKVYYFSHFPLIINFSNYNKSSNVNCKNSVNYFIMYPNAISRLYQSIFRRSLFK